MNWDGLTVGINEPLPLTDIQKRARARKHWSIAKSVLDEIRASTKGSIPIQFEVYNCDTQKVIVKSGVLKAKTMSALSFVFEDLFPHSLNDPVVFRVRHDGQMVSVNSDALLELLWEWYIETGVKIVLFPHTLADSNVKRRYRLLPLYFETISSLNEVLQEFLISPNELWRSGYRTVGLLWNDLNIGVGSVHFENEASLVMIRRLVEVCIHNSFGKILREQSRDLDGESFEISGFPRELVPQGVRSFDIAKLGLHKQLSDHQIESWDIQPLGFADYPFSEALESPCDDGLKVRFVIHQLSVLVSTLPLDAFSSRDESVVGNNGRRLVRHWIWSDGSKSEAELDGGPRRGSAVLSSVADGPGDGDASGKLAMVVPFEQRGIAIGAPTLDSMMTPAGHSRQLSTLKPHQLRKVSPTPPRGEEAKLPEPVPAAGPGPGATSMPKSLKSRSQVIAATTGRRASLVHVFNRVGLGGQVVDATASDSSAFRRQAVRMSRGGAAAFAKWLEDHGVNVSAFGIGQAKSLEQFRDEVARHASELSLVNGEVVRVVRVVSVIIRSPSKRHVLCETHRKLSDGRFIVKYRHLSKKMARVEASGKIQFMQPVVFEALSELPEASRDTARIVAVVEPESQTRSSASYPAVRSHYIVHSCDVVCPSLPPHDFSTQRSDGVQFWAWKKRVVVDIMNANAARRLKFYFNLSERADDETLGQFMFDAAAQNDTELVRAVLDMRSHNAALKPFSSPHMLRMNLIGRGLEYPFLRLTNNSQSAPMRELWHVLGSSWAVLQTEPVLGLHITTRVVRIKMWSGGRVLTERLTDSDTDLATTDFILPAGEISLEGGIVRPALEIMVGLFGVRLDPARCNVLLTGHSQYVARPSVKFPGMVEKVITETLEITPPMECVQAMMAGEDTQCVKFSNVDSRWVTRFWAWENGAVVERQLLSGAQYSAPATPRFITHTGSSELLMHAIYEAVDRRNLEVANMLVLEAIHRDKMRPNLVDSHGYTLMHYAALINSRPTLLYLMFNGGMANVVCLFCLLETDALDALELLLPRLVSYRDVPRDSVPVCHAHCLYAAAGKDRDGSDVEEERIGDRGGEGASLEELFYSLLGSLCSAGSTTPDKARKMGLLLRHCTPFGPRFTAALRRFVVEVAVQHLPADQESAIILEHVERSKFPLHACLHLQGKLRLWKDGLGSTLAQITVHEQLLQRAATLMMECASSHAILEEPLRPGLVSSTPAALALGLSLKRVVSHWVFQEHYERKWFGTEEVLTFYRSARGFLGALYRVLTSFGMLLKFLPALTLAPSVPAVAQWLQEAHAHPLLLLSCSHTKFVFHNTLYVCYALCFIAASESTNPMLFSGWETLLYVWTVGMLAAEVELFLGDQRGRSVWQLLAFITYGIILTAAGLKLAATNTSDDVTAADLVLNSDRFVMIGSCVVFIRLPHVFSAHRALGPLQISVRETITHELIIGQLTLILCGLLAFAVAFTYLFRGRGLDGFDSFGASFVSTLWVLFGQYDVELEDGDTPLLYSLLLMAFLSYTLYLLFNVLMAIIWDIYGRVQNRAELEWQYLTVSLCEHYRRVSVVPPPLNLVVLSFQLLAGVVKFGSKCCSSGRGDGSDDKVEDGAASQLQPRRTIGTRGSVDNDGYLAPRLKRLQQDMMRRYFAKKATWQSAPKDFNSEVEWEPVGRLEGAGAGEFRRVGDGAYKRSSSASTGDLGGGGGGQSWEQIVARLTAVEEDNQRLRNALLGALRLGQEDQGSAVNPGGEENLMDVASSRTPMSKAHSHRSFSFSRRSPLPRTKTVRHHEGGRGFSVAGAKVGDEEQGNNSNFSELAVVMGANTQAWVDRTSREQFAGGRKGDTRSDNIVDGEEQDASHHSKTVSGDQTSEDVVRLM